MTKINDEDFSLFVNESSFLYEIAQKCGYKTGSNLRPSLRDKIKKRICDLGLNTSHFKYSYPKPLSEKLVLQENRTRNSSCFKKRLYKEGLLHEICSLCNQTNIHNGKKLVLQLDHINGNHNDNRIENLRILCPNCHSQTSTFCKNKKWSKPGNSIHRGGAEEACWAHNPKVGGSKPPPDKVRLS